MSPELAIEAIKANLEKEKARILGSNSQHLPVIERNDGFMDRADRANCDCEVNSFFDDLKHANVNSINRALEKINDGTYGICDDCGEPIGPDRLEAKPGTPFCVNCTDRAAPAITRSRSRMAQPWCFGKHSRR